MVLNHSSPTDFFHAGKNLLDSLNHSVNPFKVHLHQLLIALYDRMKGIGPSSKLVSLPARLKKLSNVCRKVGFTESVI